MSESKPQHRDYAALVREFGDVVVRMELLMLGADGRPGTEVIYRFKGEYWPHDRRTGFVYGSFDSLAQAVANSSIRVTRATRKIDCRELTAAELAAMIPAGGPFMHAVLLNGEPWRVDYHGRLMPCVAPGERELNRLLNDPAVRPPTDVEWWMKGLLLGGPRDGQVFYFTGEPQATATTTARLESGAKWNPVYCLADESRAESVPIEVRQLETARDEAEVVENALADVNPVIYRFRQ